MKEFEIYYTDEAIEDLKAIYQYIATIENEPINALNLVNAIREAINSLNIFPLRYPEVRWSPWKEIGMRNMVIKKHIVFYQVNELESVINIVRIMSCRRDIPANIKEE